MNFPSELVLFVTDLFSSPDSEARREQLQLMFERWLEGRQSAPPSAGRGARPLREDSADVYRDMWGAFATWCVVHDCEPSSIDAPDLELFLSSLGGATDIGSRYRRRVLQLIARIDVFDARATGRRPNLAIVELKASSAYRFAAAAEEPLPEFLTAGEARRLIEFVTQKQRAPSSNLPWTWKTARDRTAIALQLGGGITPGEARALRVSQIVTTGGPAKDEPWALSLPGNGNFPPRQTPLARWAGRQLLSWLQIRREQAFPGEVVFPSTRSGKQWSTTNSYQAFCDVLSQAGIASAGGSFKLRHTFAIRQLTRHPPAQVARWLGVDDPEVMERYRQVLFQPVDVV